MDILANVMLGFQVALQPANLFFCFMGVLIGTLVGVLPGLGPVAAMSLLLPTTLHLSPVSAVIMLSGIYYGAMYGGSTTSILVNIPGEAASVITCLDGYQMARKGRAGAALGIAFGNFKAGYLIAERSETAILRDPYSNKPFVNFYAVKRVGGCVSNSEAIKVLKFSAS